jgi:aminoglycoside phosphotransferase (APT) family kinase protein
MKDQAGKIRSGEEINQDALSLFLKDSLIDFPGILSIKQFPGGFSNLTYQIETSNANYVLRKPPKGAAHIKGGHNMGREFNVLVQLEKSGFKYIPKPILFTENAEIIGSEFYLMEKVEGVIIRNSKLIELKEWLSPSNLSHLSQNLAKTLASLHQIDIYQSGLMNLGKPEGYISRQLKGWFERYKNSETQDLHQIDKIYEWLVKNQPKEIAPSLIHNDYKYDNVCFDIDSKEIIALLDWEMCTVGDPRMDIGTTLSYWCEAKDGDFEKTFNLTYLQGNISRDEFVKIYSEANPIDLSEILYFYVFGLFKNSVVIQQIYARYKKGFTKDPRFSQLNLGVERLLEKAMLSIESGKMK